MNAIELSEALENIGYVTNVPHLANKAASMLRDQAVRIEQLEQMHDYLYKKHDEQADRIKELEEILRVINQESTK